MAYAHTSFFTTDVAEELAYNLVAKSPDGLNYVYLVSGGSEAIEAALKLARQYFVERGEPERHRIIARRQSYHGNTLGALAAGGNEWRRRPFSPLLIKTYHIEPCDAYRGQQPGEDDYSYAARCADALEEEILRLGPASVMAFIAEPVVGAAAGVVPAVADYFKRIRGICDRYGVLLILDEVMCGMGRTGSLYACEQEGVVPDLLTIAKGLGGGYQPIGALLASEKVAETIFSGSGHFQHGHTYIGHPTACAAALTVQMIIERDQLLQNVVTRGDQLKRLLSERFGDHPYIGDIRGRGLFIGVELVADRHTKTPFSARRRMATTVKRAALDRGLMIYPNSGTIDGTVGDCILLAPPFIVDEPALFAIVERLGDAVDAATGIA
jgi:adenosylmethionine-8-amino-7-oxononanoate aminotransferase